MFRSGIIQIFLLVGRLDVKYKDGDDLSTEFIARAGFVVQDAGQVRANLYQVWAVSLCSTFLLPSEANIHLTKHPGHRPAYHGYAERLNISDITNFPLTESSSVRCVAQSALSTLETLQSLCAEAKFSKRDTISPYLERYGCGIEVSAPSHTPLV